MQKKALAWILLSVFTLFGLGTIRNVKDMIAYDSAVIRTVEVEATVAEVDEYEDSDGYTMHDLYISYTYAGETYRPEYNVKDASDWEDRIGETITVRIDPENPDEPVTNLITGRFGVYFGAVFFLAAAGVAARLLDQYQPDGTIPDRDTLHSRVWGWAKHRFVVPVVIALVGVALELLHWRCPRSGEGMFLDIVGYVLIALALWRLIQAVRWLRMAKDQDYEVVYGRLAEKIYQEGESSDTYRLKFTGSHSNFTKDVDPDVFHAAEEGAVGMAVYLPGKKTAILTFHAKPIS